MQSSKGAAARLHEKPSAAGENLTSEQLEQGQAASARSSVRESTSFDDSANHQGLGNELVQPRAGPESRDGPVRCHSRLGGLLNLRRSIHPRSAISFALNDLRG